MSQPSTLSKNQLAQRRAIAAKGGRALVEQYGRDHMAEIGRKGGKWNFFDQVQKANALSEASRRRSKQRPSKTREFQEDAAKPPDLAGAHREPSRDGNRKASIIQRPGAISGSRLKS